MIELNSQQMLSRRSPAGTAQASPDPSASFSHAISHQHLILVQQQQPMGMRSQQPGQQAMQQQPMQVTKTEQSYSQPQQLTAATGTSTSVGQTIVQQLQTREHVQQPGIQAGTERATGQSYVDRAGLLAQIRGEASQAEALAAINRVKRAEAYRDALQKELALLRNRAGMSSQQLTGNEYDALLKRIDELNTLAFESQVS